MQILLNSINTITWQWTGVQNTTTKHTKPIQLQIPYHSMRAHSQVTSDHKRVMIVFVIWLDFLKKLLLSRLKVNMNYDQDLGK